ncbi:MAG: glycosyltransferase [Clostridiaceae bacterium]|nr:glycosyltransferase [Clostridiaceae bacterium]
MAQKLISVCINAYNSENTIKETLESVLNQTYENLQVIVVDDCSTDKTADIVEEFASRDSRVELYRLPENGNISNANNEALSHARGEYIAHLDSDDVWLPDKIEKQAAFLEEYPEYGACFTHVQSVDEDGTPLGENAYFDKLFNIGNMTQAQWVRYFFYDANHICHSTMLIRKSIQDKLGGHNLSLLYLHDYDMWARLILICPIHIIQEPLIKYRVRMGSNSQPTREKKIAHNEEFARVAYNMIDNCPDGLFLEAFSDILKYGGEHSHTDVEFEKAFLLLDGFRSLLGNTVIGIRKFDEIFADKENLKIAKEHFNFSLRDFYDLHNNEIYFDRSLREDYEKACSELDYVSEKLRKTVDERDREKLNNKRLDEQISSLRWNYAALEGNYNVVLNSRSMKLTMPIRKFNSFRYTCDYLKGTKLSTGVPSAAKVVLYGFFGHNLGDDMFFDMLFRRYPNTLFCVEHTTDYEGFVRQYPNAKFFDIKAPHYKKLDDLGSKFGIENWSQKMLYKTSDAAVHIGGSIYQQIADWQIDIEQRKKRNSQFKNFFAISNNFGPYSTDDYRQFWTKEFEHYTDVCFRDMFSYMMFEGLNNVRYAPDLLFSFNDPTPATVEKRVSISVINPRFRVRSFSEEQSELYEKKILELVRYYIDKGYAVTLLGFCALEEDRQEVEKLWLELDYRYREKTDMCNYGGDYHVIVDELKKSEIVIATRFHAMILGYVLGKKVLPICYGDKVTNVINDLHLMFNPVTFDTLGEYSAEQLDKKANSIDAARIAELRANADSQFAALDNYIASRGGTVIR